MFDIDKEIKEFKKYFPEQVNRTFFLDVNNKHRKSKIKKDFTTAAAKIHSISLEKSPDISLQAKRTILESFIKKLE